ncbi:MAG TPA: hypothetical protein VLG93_00055, partial [Sulfuricaulis sp.]|nr:hypothetical protein [Sulfuricaulis sp.]
FVARGAISGIIRAARQVLIHMIIYRREHRVRREKLETWKISAISAPSAVKSHIPEIFRHIG